MILPRRQFLVGGSAMAATALTPSTAGTQVPGTGENDLVLTGRLVQGGHAIGRTWPRALVFVDGEALTTASADGTFIVGFDRDAPTTTQIEVRSVAPPGRSARQTLAVAPGRFASTCIDGLPPATIAPTDPDLLARIQREIALKTEGFASRTDADHFSDGFTWPLERFRVSSRWGSQRVLNGTPARPHYGIDLAAPQGTPIRAPADGRVTFARTDLHFEGGLVLIDHGQGLITAYLHQSRLDVRAGQSIRRGERIGRVGMSGRATGPHLCWRMKWRDRNLDPSLLVENA